MGGEEVAGCLEAAALASLRYACEESRATSPRIRLIIITIHMGLDLISKFFCIYLVNRNGLGLHKTLQVIAVDPW